MNTSNHAIISEARKALLKAKASPDGILSFESMDSMDVRISTDCIDRCLNFLETMLNAVGGHGFVIEIDNKENDKGSYLRKGKERVQFHVEEELEATPHILTKEEEKKVARKQFLYGSFGMYPKEMYLLQWEPPQFDYRPSGRLIFKIDNISGSGLRQKWCEKPGRTLNDLLPKLILNIVKAAEYLNNERIEWERREREWEEEKRRSEAREFEQKLEEKRIKLLNKLLRNWSEQKKILEFLVYIENEIPANKRTEDFTDWLEWVDIHATRLTPTAEIDLE